VTRGLGGDAKLPPATNILTNRALNRATLARQMLLAREKSTALRAVERLAGLQAQLARPPFFGLWSRLEGFRPEDLMKPVHARKIVRATLMRGTLHLVTAEDYRALRPLLQPMLSASMPARAEVHGEEARTGLGAGAADIGWMVIREALAVTAAGMAIALPAAGWLSRLVASQLYGVRSSDPRP
jgi:hypothetical protein